jgi:hypothetical protein
MPNPVAVNDLSPISGSLQTSRISYAVETAGKDYGQDYNSTTWYSDIPNNGQFYTIISDNYTANYYVSRSNAEGAYVEGGLPAVDEYSAPVFWVTPGTSSLDIITIVNGLPDRRGQIPFISGSEALNWVASSSNYFAVGPDYYAQVDADNLGFYFEGNQIISYPTTGSTWYDLSGNGNNGTFQNGGPSFNTNGWLSFDGTDDFIQIPDSATTSNTSSLSICALVKFNSLSSTYQGIIGKGSGSNPDANEEYVLSINNANLYFDIGIGSGPYINPSLSLTTGRWYHISATQARTNGTSSLVAYSNGSPLSATVIGSLNTPNNNEYPVSIGRRAYSGFPYGNDSFNGDMASIQLYLKTLSATEVAQNYYGGPIVTDGLVFAVDAGNLVSYPKSGTSWYNLTSSVDGTLTNGPTFSPTDGGVLVFDGTDDYVDFGSPTSLFNPATSTMTMMGWIYVKNNQTNILIGLQESGAGSLSLGTNSSGNVRFICRPTAGSQGTIDSSATLALNTWYHIAMTKDTANSISDCTLWINGVAVNTASSTVNFPTSTAAIRSAYYFDANIYSNINIGIIQVYNRALTAAEVLQNYNATK